MLLRISLPPNPASRWGVENSFRKNANPEKEKPEEGDSELGYILRMIRLRVPTIFPSICLCTERNLSFLPSVMVPDPQLYERQEPTVERYVLHWFDTYYVSYLQTYIGINVYIHVQRERDGEKDISIYTCIQCEHNVSVSVYINSYLYI